MVEAGLHGLAYLFFTGGSMGVLRYALRTKMDSPSLFLDKEAAAEDDMTTWL